MATEDREENLRVSGHDWPEEFAAHSALRSLRRANTVVSVGTIITTSTPSILLKMKTRARRRFKTEGLDLLFLNSITGFGPSRYRHISYRNFH
jgi:hypothetical protein